MRTQCPMRVTPVQRRVSHACDPRVRHVGASRVRETCVQQYGYRQFQEEIDEEATEKLYYRWVLSRA